MSKGPDQLAHQRLVSMAQDRRRAAEKLPPLSGITRERLLAEVDRVRGEAARLAEDPSRTPRATAWQAWVTWLGVGAAVGVLILVVRLSNPEPRVRPGDMATASRESSGPTFSAAAEPPTDPPAPVPSQPAATQGEAILADAEVSVVVGSPGTGGATDVAGVTEDVRMTFRSAPVDGSNVSGSSPALAAPASASAGRSLLAAARRIRRSYQAVASQGNSPPFLRSFEVSQMGSWIRLVEPDGSAYTGRISRLPRSQGQTGPMEWSFEGKGNRRSVAGSVWMVGNFVAPAPSSDDSAIPEVLDATLQMTVQIDGTQLFELRAAPAGP